MLLGGVTAVVVGAGEEVTWLPGYAGVGELEGARGFYDEVSRMLVVGEEAVLGGGSWVGRVLPGGFPEGAGVVDARGQSPGGGLWLG